MPRSGTPNSVVVAQDSSECAKRGVGRGGRRIGKVGRRQHGQAAESLPVVVKAAAILRIRSRGSSAAVHGDAEQHVHPLASAAKDTAAASSTEVLKHTQSAAHENDVATHAADALWSWCFNDAGVEDAEPNKSAPAPAASPWWLLAAAAAASALSTRKVSRSSLVSKTRPSLRSTCASSTWGPA
jgi:hypothetical protein